MNQMITKMDAAYNEFVNIVKEALRKGIADVVIVGKTRKVEVDNKDLANLAKVFVDGKPYSLDGELKSKCELAIDGLLGPDRVRDGLARMELIQERLRWEAEKAKHKAAKAAFQAARDASVQAWGEGLGLIAFKAFDPKRDKKLAVLSRIPRYREAAKALINVFEQTGKMPATLEDAIKAKAHLPFLSRQRAGDEWSAIKALVNALMQVKLARDNRR